MEKLLKTKTISFLKDGSLENFKKQISDAEIVAKQDGFTDLIVDFSAEEYGTDVRIRGKRPETDSEAEERIRRDKEYREKELKRIAEMAKSLGYSLQKQ